MASLVLASASPRRKELLQELGIPFTVCPAEIDEEAIPFDGAADAFVLRLAREKAAAVQNIFPDQLVLAADTIVVTASRELLGKPKSVDEAEAMLRRLSGERHQVLTGFCLSGPEAAVVTAQAVATEVFFRSLHHEEIARYVASGEPMDKAGGYAIQGGAASFVSRIEGSYTNVVGLPLAEVVEAFTAAGLLPP